MAALSHGARPGIERRSARRRPSASGQPRSSPGSAAAQAGAVGIAVVCVELECLEELTWSDLDDLAGRPDLELRLREVKVEQDRSFTARGVGRDPEYAAGE